MNKESKHRIIKKPFFRFTDKLINYLSDSIFYLAILFFIIGFNFSDRMAGNWYQQFIPNLNGRTLNDITFVDSLTGYAIAGPNPFDTNYVVKTTSGGNDWDIIYRIYKGLNRINFVDNNTGFICGGGANYLGKTINGGINWQQIITPNGLQLIDMHILNADTLWIMDEAIGSHIYLTTNSGVNWTLQYTNLSVLEKLYFYNYRIGFTCTSSKLYKTTDSGFNWNEILDERGFRDIYFIDSLTGWKSNTISNDTNMRKTTNGGLNWQKQQLPTGSNISSGMNKFSNLNKDTIWGVGGVLEYPNLQSRGILYRTTNGGQNWLFQVPDTSFNIFLYGNIEFYNRLIGWAYNFSTKGIHTTNGGDTTFYIGIQQTSSNIPKEFDLKQNYPNPFNPKTVIPYKLKKPSYVRLIAYEITGKETQIMVNQHQSAGEYEADFIGKFAISSGVYFYRIEVTDDKSKQLYTETKKMILLK